VTHTRRAIAFLAALAAYAVLLVVSIALLSSGQVSDGLRVVVVLLPLPAAIAIVVVALATFLASDELQQRTQLIGLAVSFLGTLVLTISWGFLEGIGFERLSGFVVFAVLVALYIVGFVVAQRRYR
jgi:hypothetical protein